MCAIINYPDPKVIGFFKCLGPLSILLWEGLRLFYVYVLECQTPNHFYIGQTNDVERRVGEHRTGLGAQFTIIHGVKELIETYEYPTRGEALHWERTLTYRYLLFPSVVASRGNTKISLATKKPREYYERRLKQKSRYQKGYYEEI